MSLLLDGIAARMATERGKIEAARRAMAEVGRQAITEGSREIFDAFPAVESFGWAQYTHYYNDGDPCVFSVSVGTDAIWINATRYDDAWVYGPNWERVGPVAEMAGVPKAAWEAVAALLGAIDEDAYEEMFGDHVQVTVYRDGHTEAEGYDHD